MAETEAQTGRCLCGAVRFTVTEPVTSVGACHCAMCRRWTGGPLLALHCEGPVAFEGEEHIVRYRSSEWAERGFCGICGSNLFYKIVESELHIMAAGLLDDQSDLTLDSQIFIDEKPGFYDFANQTSTMTGAEVFAKFAPSAD